jgi:uncharacterized OB-fold protein
MSTSPNYWRQIPQRYRLEASKCTKCGKVHFPPRLVCDDCGNKDFEPTVLGREGTLVTYTIIRVPPGQFTDQAPFAVGIVELDGGAKITAQLVDVDFEDLEIGQKMKVEFRRIQSEGKAGIINYGYKCVPVR